MRKRDYENDLEESIKEAQEIIDQYSSWADHPIIHHKKSNKKTSKKYREEP